MTTEPKTLEQLNAEMIGLWEKHTEAAAKRDLKAAGQVMGEMRKVQTAIAGFETAQETGAREAAIATMQDGLKGIDFRTLLPGVSVSGTFRRTDTGFDDLSIGVGYAGEVDLAALFHSLFPIAAVQDLKSVKGIKFSITRSGAAVEYTGRQPGSGTGGGGTSGKGWVKDGATSRLNEVWEAHATDEQKAEMEDLSGDGNKTYGLKVKVAKEAGYTKND